MPETGLPGRSDPAVAVEENVTFRKTPERDLRLDLYLPEDGEREVGIVCVHGGGFRGGSKNQFSRQATALADRGFVAASIEYRLSHEAQFPAAAVDTKAAIEWLRTTDRYGLDVRDVGVTGGSAGGHLAAFAAVTADVPEFAPDAADPDDLRVQAAAPFNAPLDFTELRREPIVDFLGGTNEEIPDAYERASPATYVSDGVPPFLLLHGTDDVTIPYAQSVRFRNQLRRTNAYAELFRAAEATHGFFNDSPWFEQTYWRLEQFFDETLRS